jgi:hypothetical protein
VSDPIPVLTVACCAAGYFFAAAYRFATSSQLIVFHQAVA